MICFKLFKSKLEPLPIILISFILGISLLLSSNTSKGIFSIDFFENLFFLFGNNFLVENLYVCSGKKCSDIIIKIASLNLDRRVLRELIEL